MEVITYGPTGALLGLTNVDAELHGVRVRNVGSGRTSNNDVLNAETKLTICYVDGKRSNRRAALARLCQYISDGEKVEIAGRVEAPFKIASGASA